MNRAISINNNLTVSGDIQVNGTIKDSSGNSGINGEVLTSTGSGWSWSASNVTESSVATPLHAFDFGSSVNNYNYPVFRFEDNRIATATSTSVTWDYSIGLTTDPNGSLDLTPFEISSPLSIEWYGSLDAISEDWQKIWSFYDNQTYNLSLYRVYQTNQLQFQYNNGGRRATTRDLPDILSPGLAPVHIVCTLSEEGNMVIYINGEPSSTESNYITPFVTKTYNYLTLGRDVWGDIGTETTKYFAFYNTVLSPLQIISSYTIRNALNPNKEYIFTTALNDYSFPTFTFFNSTTAIATSTSVTWNSSFGLTTDPNGSLDLTPFEISAPLSIEWYGSLDAISDNWQKIWSFYNNQTYNLSLYRVYQTNQLRFQYNDGGHNATTPDLPGILSIGLAPVHILCTLSEEGNMVIYINSFPSSTESNAITPFVAQTYNYITLGRDAWGDIGTETTKLFAYYNKQLSEEEIKILYMYRTNPSSLTNYFQDYAFFKNIRALDYIDNFKIINYNTNTNEFFYLSEDQKITNNLTITGDIFNVNDIRHIRYSPSAYEIQANLGEWQGQFAKSKLLLREYGAAIQIRDSNNQTIAGITPHINGVIYHTGAFSSVSDDRFKSYETDVSGATNMILKLNPKFYKKHPTLMTDDSAPDLSGVINFDEYGFIAQELNEDPELSHFVKINPQDNKYHVNYIEMIPILVQTIKELNERINILTDRIQTLETN